MNYLIKLNNVISRAHHWSTFKELPLRINYGSFKTVVRYNAKLNKITYFCEANWVHTSRKSKKSKWFGLCTGVETGYYIGQIVRSDKTKNEKQKELEHILYDYFSVCLSDHTDIMGIPSGVYNLTNDDLFICRIKNRCFHKSMMREDVKNVSKIVYLNGGIKEYLNPKDNHTYPLDIDKYYMCQFCCYSLCKKTDKKCFSCGYNI